jgi:hypothetical protein
LHRELGTKAIPIAKVLQVSLYQYIQLGTRAARIVAEPSQA